MTKVSCILPVNKADHSYLDQAIKSILTQTYQDFELLIIANNCNDALWKHISQYNDSRIKKFRLELGQLSFAINFGIENAKGQLIARMDADDISHPERFKKQVDFFSNNNVDILGTQIKGIDHQGNELNFTRNLPADNTSIRKKLVFTNPLIHPSIMIKKSTLIRLGGYQKGNGCEDYELWLRAVKDKTIIFSNIFSSPNLITSAAGKPVSFSTFEI